MDLKKPTTFEEQIERLKSHKIQISDEASTIQILKEISYYRITGYALQFRMNSHDSDCVPGTSFNSVLNLYYFDQDLRSLLRKYLEIAEIYLKTQIAHVFSISKCTKPPHDQHYDPNNFYNKTGYSEVMDSFTKDKKYYRDSLIFQHHQSNYANKMPLWAMVELLSFSNVSKLYSSMYISDKEKIASVFGISEHTLTNHLHCLSVLRNRCAHCARLYNTPFNPPAHFTSTFLRKNPGVRQDTLFAYILVLLKRLPNPLTKRNLLDELSAVLSNYPCADFSLIGFPESWTDILQNSIPNK